jgi:ADP-ribose pyrophosphatase YjhB (NUDIX family)
MYKVYINNRKIIFSDNHPDSSSASGVQIYEYSDKKPLQEKISLFLEEEFQKNLWIKCSDEKKSFDAFQDVYPIRKAAGGVVKNEQGETLCIHRLGKWDLPKGHKEKGELINDTAIREIQEETGLKEVSITSPLPTTYHMYRIKDKWVLKKNYWFLCSASSDQPLTPQIEEGISITAWLGDEDIEEFKPQIWPSLWDLFFNEDKE